MLFYNFHILKKQVEKRLDYVIMVWHSIDADVAKLADALDLGSSAARRAGSIPVIRTIKKICFKSFIYKGLELFLFFIDGFNGYFYNSFFTSFTSNCHWN